MMVIIRVNGFFKDIVLSHNRYFGLEKLNSRSVLKLDSVGNALEEEKYAKWKGWLKGYGKDMLWKSRAVQV